MGTAAYNIKNADVFSGMVNTAAYSYIKSAAAGVYGEKRFLMKELGSYAAIVAMPIKQGVAGLQMDYFGSASFNESQFGLFYARKVSEMIDVGVKLNYYSVAVPGYGRAAAATFEAGVLFHLTEKLHSGLHIYNPGGSKIGKQRMEQLPAIYKYGLGYEFSESVFIIAQVEKVEDMPVEVSSTLQYNINKMVYIRAGFATGATGTFAGFGYILPFARVGISAAYHQYLGFTPGVQLIFEQKNKKAAE